MEVYEKIFFGIAAAMLVIFLAALAYTALVLHIVLPGHAGQIIPKPGEPLATAVLKTPPFDNPGVRKLADGGYEVDVMAEAWYFFPNKIQLPVGRDVTFRATSVDVTHGFMIPGTRVNMMIIPGYVTVEKYRFTRPGHYMLICHEYCGRGHHTMAATVDVR